jgi:cellulose synthase operon protein C
MTSPKLPPTYDVPPDRVLDEATQQPGALSDRSQVASRSMPLAELGGEIGDAEFDPDVVLASLAPYDESDADVETIPPPVAFANERPAHVSLASSDYTDRLRAIATRLQKSIADDSSSTRKAEYSLVASEILALTGDITEAQTLALGATAAQPGSRLAHTQARHLALEAGDLDAVQQLTADEIQTLNDEASLTHIHLWHSEFSRIVACDRSAATGSLHAAAQIAPRDAQVNLLQLLENLGGSDPVDLEWAAESPTLAGIFESIQLLVRLRQGKQFAAPGQNHNALTLLGVTSALAEGDTAAAALQLARFAPLEGSNNALRWLRASLWAARSDTRQSAVDELTELQRDEPDAEVRRALLERSVELRDVELTRRLLLSVDPATNDTESTANDLVLALLAVAPAAFVLGCCNRLANEDKYAPLTLAAKCLLHENASHWHEIDEAPRLAAAWAEWLSSTQPGDKNPTAPPLTSDLDTVADDVVALNQVFALEAARQKLDWNTVAKLVLALPDDAEPWLPGDLQTVAALFFEAGHDREAAQLTWQDALAARPLRESALRATLDIASSSETVALLERTATSLNVRDERGVWFMLEAALADASANYEKTEEQLLHAHVLDPTLIVPILMGEALARKHGESSHVAEWVAKRRELADEVVESALAAVEQAFLLWHHDQPAAEACVTHAVDEASDDSTLYELLRHIAPKTAGMGSANALNLSETDPDAIEHLCQSAAQAAWMGDWRLANDIALSLAGTETNTVANLWAEQAATSGRSLPKLFDQLFAEARAENDPIVQCELYGRLAQLDSNSKSEGNFGLWQNAIIERAPNHLPALRALERSFIQRQQWQELAVVAEKLMQQLGGQEALGYCWLAGTLHIYAGNWAASEPLLQWAALQETAPLWALRRWYSHVQSKKDWKSMHSVECRLIDKANYLSDSTSLLIRSAQSAQQMQMWNVAASQLKRAVDASPDSVVAWCMLSIQQLEQGDLSGAAEGFEHLSQICVDQGHRKGFLARAAELWLSLKDDARAESNLEQLVAADSRDAESVEKLTQCYRKSHAHDRLAALLERLIEQGETAAERAPLQIERARCLIALGLTIAADKAVQPVLIAFPDSLEALEIKAEVAAALDDSVEAESIYLRLLKLANDPARQAGLQRKLGQLYEKLSGRSDAAETAYRRLLELVPDDAPALAALVRLAVNRNDSAEAIRLQTQLMEKASEPVEQRERYLELAQIHETSAHDRRRAEEVLERARRKWQNDSVVLQAFAAFYQRAGDTSALQVLLERSVTEARRALHTGRFELSLFEVLATVAHLRDEPLAAEAADAVVATLTTHPVDLQGVGSAAFEPRHDEGLAPELLNLPLRAMLQKSGWVLDAVSPIDLRAYEVVPLSQVNPSLHERALQLASSFCVDDLQLWVTDKAGCICLPVQSRPPILLLGRTFIKSVAPVVIEFSLMRALKVVQAHMTGLARTAAVDLGPLIAAYLSSYLPDWQPTGVDARKVEDYRRQLVQQLPQGHDHIMSPLAQDVVVALGNRASQLGEAVCAWGSRTALLALGNPAVALEAMTFAVGSGPLQATDVAERIKWIARHAEARNVMVFAVSDAYLRLRTQLL